MRDYLLIAMVFIITACTTTGPSPDSSVPPDPETVLKQVPKDLAEGKPLEAAVSLKNLGLLNPPGTPEAQAVHKALMSRAEDLLTGKDWIQFQGFRQDLLSLGLDVQSPLGEAQGLEAFYRDSGWSGAQVSEVLDRLESLPAPRRLEVAAQLKSSNYYQAFSLAVKGLEKNLSPDQLAYLGKKPQPKDMIRGTVTVLVNKGLKVEKGLAAPEIVVGSGFFIDPTGHLITNYHVIQSEVDPEYEGYSRLFISLPDSHGERIPARVVGWDQNLDVALVKAEVTPEYVFSLAPRPDLNEGDRLYAIGSPGGLEATFTSGIVSATARKFLPMGEAIQMDVAVNPGSSGGPLVDEQGWVVGLVFSGIPEFQGVNFAVSAEYIRRILPRLYAGGEVPHHWLGLGGLRSRQGLDVDFVAQDGPAQKAGIRVGDRIEALQDVELAGTREDPHQILLDARRVVKIRLNREGQVKEVYLLRSTRPREPLVQALKAQSPQDVAAHLFGFRLEPQGNPTEGKARILGAAPGTMADTMGLAEGDPFVLQNWEYLKDLKAFKVRIMVKRRLGGYFETFLELIAGVDSPRIY